MIRVVAQLGRALGSGPRGRWFKSSQPDHFSFFNKLFNFPYLMLFKKYRFLKKSGVTAYLV